MRFISLIPRHVTERAAPAAFVFRARRDRPAGGSIVVYRYIRGMRAECAGWLKTNGIGRV
jgi:hypothetical protein